MNQEKRILVCEDSMKGIFSSVYIGEPACVRLPRLQDARFRNLLRLL